MSNHASTTRNRSVVGRTLGVAFRKRTYANMAYLLARFPLGIAYFTVFVTGISLGIALTPLVVGIPILAGVLALAGYVGRVEAGLLREVLGRDVTWSTADAVELGPVSVGADTANQLSVTTLPEALVASLLGVAILIAGLHVVNGIAALLATFAERVLATRTG